MLLFHEYGDAHPERRAPSLEQIIMPIGVESRFYWIMTTRDEYELTLIVAETREELAALAGVRASSISEEMSRAKARGLNCQYKKVPKEEYINLEEDDELSKLWS